DRTAARQLCVRDDPRCRDLLGLCRRRPRRRTRRVHGGERVTELIQFTLFGLMLGCVYAIAAMGLVLTYNVTGVFNIAHGAVGMLAAFVYYQLRVRYDWPTPIAVIVVVLVFAPIAG